MKDYSKKTRLIIIFVLLTIEFISIFLACKSLSHKPTKIDEVKLKDNVVTNKSKKGLAIMLNNGDGKYIKSTENKWPTEGYLYNNEKSGCIDTLGNTISDALTYNQTTNKLSLRVNQKVYCYLYFDKKDKPVIDKFYINAETENKTTKEPEVTIHLKWSDVYITEYCITEENNVDSCTWIPSNSVTEISSNYTFTEEGSKIFYAYIKDIAKGISEVKSDNIEYKKEKLADKLINNPISGVIEPTGVAQDELATRYYGTNPPNYICFGTTNKSVCIGDQDKYMYRIIGVDKSGRYKVIKKEALNTSYYWHNVYNRDITWPNSDLYKGLNGISGGKYSNLFIGNSTYMPSGWSDKIDTIAWKYGDITDVNKTADQMIQIEQAWSSIISSRIGLMYLADYYYAYQKSGLNCSVLGQYTTCKTSWMHISQNDSAPPSSDAELTMARYGRDSNGYYIAWNVTSNGDAHDNSLTLTFPVRPVFYIVASAQISGSGTIDDPYVIVN